MIDLSRRDFVVSTGLAAALGLNARLVMPAFAQKTADPPKPFVTYKVGSAEVTAIYDGIWEKPHDPAFISNASVDDVKAAMVKAGLPADFVSIPFTVAVVKNGGKTIMCDSGTGGQVQPTAGKLAANMKAAGIDAGKIDTILISHCHPDHIFGLMEKDTNKPVYPECRDRHLGRGVQVLDRPCGHRPLAGSAEGLGAPHPGDVPELEECASGLRARLKWRPASVSCSRRGIHLDTARSISPRDRTS